MYSHPYTYEETYQLIKAKYPQYEDDTIVIKKYGNKPSFTFKELVLLILEYKQLIKLEPYICRTCNKITRNFKKIFGFKNTAKYWSTLLLDLVNLKYCPFCTSIYYINNFSKKSRICRQCDNIKSKKYRETHLEQCKQTIRNHYKNNKEYYLKRNSIQRARFKEKTPKWLTNEDRLKIIEIYLNRHEGYHVDHIIPLNGENVCGLHVPSNLQYLTAHDNLAKHNKFEPILLVKGIDY